MISLHQTSIHPISLDEGQDILGGLSMGAHGAMNRFKDSIQLRSH